MPYARWGVTNATIQTLTGLASEPTDEAVEAAEEEVYDWLGWRPDPDDYGSADPDAVDFDTRVRAFGRAIAWQVAFRQDEAASATDGDGGTIQSESIDNYAVTFRRGSGPDGVALVPARAQTLLSRSGWLSPVRSGRSHTGPVPR